MAKKNSRWAVNLTALVLAVGLLMGLFTGCPNGSGPNRPNESAQPNGQVQPTDPSIFKTDKHGKITGYKCAKEELPAHLVIPAKIENEEIKEIGWGAFEDCTGLTSAVFEDKEGWKVYDDNSYSGTSTSISSSDLADTSKAAKYLREKTDKGGYCNKYWKKN